MCLVSCSIHSWGIGQVDQPSFPRGLNSFSRIILNLYLPTWLLIGLKMIMGCNMMIDPIFSHGIIDILSKEICSHPSLITTFEVPKRENMFSFRNFLSTLWSFSWHGMTLVHWQTYLTPIKMYEWLKEVNKGRMKSIP